MVLPLITLPYVIKTLGFDNYGLIILASSLIAYFQSITDFSFRITATRDVAVFRDSPKKLNLIYSKVLMIKAIFLLVSFALLTIIILVYPTFYKERLVFFLTMPMLLGYTFIYTKDNKYNFIGDYRYMIYPQYTYGLGENTSEDPQSTVDYQQIRFYQFINRKIKGDFRLGLGFQCDSYQDISETSEITEPTDFNVYMEGDYSNELSSGIALQALYDSRKNTLNPTQGYYIEADYRINSTIFGSDKNWNSFYFDARNYFSLSDKSHKVFASRLFYWSVFNGKPHYLDLPSIGWDRYGKTGRGFTRNRYRSNALLYFETEYRTDITKNGFLGAVFFANISSVSDLNTYQFNNWNPAIGTGLRVKWNKFNGCNLALDFGVSKEDFSFRLSLSENF